MKNRIKASIIVIFIATLLTFKIKKNSKVPDIKNSSMYRDDMSTI